MRRQRFSEKPSDRNSREKAESIGRLRKLARKQAIRDGLIAAPVRKPAANGQETKLDRAAMPLDRGTARMFAQKQPVVGRGGDGADAFDQLTEDEFPIAREKGESFEALRCSHRAVGCILLSSLCAAERCRPLRPKLRPVP